MKKQFSEMNNGERVDFYLSVVTKMQRLKCHSRAETALREANYYLSLPADKMGEN